MWTENSNVLFWIIIRPKFRNMSNKPGWRDHSLLNSNSRPASRVAMCVTEEWDSDFKNVITRPQSLTGCLQVLQKPEQLGNYCDWTVGLTGKSGFDFRHSHFFFFSKMPKLNVELRSYTLPKSNFLTLISWGRGRRIRVWPDFQNRIRHWD
jgi:hypothetical protein